MNAPDVSIALLTRDGGPLVARLLDAVAAQETERAVELVAIDSGSTDGTVARLEAAGARVECIEPESFNFGRTRDRLYAMTEGPIVVNLSQDAIPAHGQWLERLVAPLGDERVAVTCGASAPDPERGPQFPWERNGYFYFTREMQRFRARYGRGVSFANSAVRRSVWHALRFDPQILGEDFQFQIKAMDAGYTIAFPEGAHVLHHHDYTLECLYQRCRDEGEALAGMGCAYGAGDCARDVVHPRVWRQFAREAVRGRLRTPAAWAFPVVRPWAVWRGSRGV